jgi:3'-phosphoadenosine 5'-phosphosulfate sulfotransferase (PAPS reductase)/FAD synthetase
MTKPGRATTLEPMMGPDLSDADPQTGVGGRVTPTVAVVSVSGGKDSQETANRAIDAYGRQFVRLVMADTGHEHPLTMDFVRNDLPAMLDLPVTILRADFRERIAGKRRFIAQNWEYMGVPLARIDRALELLHPTGNPYLDLCMWKGRFPSRKAQFCTQFLKGDLLDGFIIDLLRDGPVESWQGIRRDESQNRRDALAYEAACLDRPWPIVRPIVDLTAQQTVDAILARGQWLNPLYSLGMKRVGCMPCINCGKDEVMEISDRWPEEIDRVREWEFIVADVSKPGSATFFADPIKQGRERQHPSGEYARIDAVVAWSKTSRGGKQFDLLRAIPSATCSSLYGLRE